ncbi:MAG: endonuclease III [Chloroflexi bacterium]|nr:endonuclease III [Chloroflexota bacterium]
MSELRETSEDQSFAEEVALAARVVAILGGIYGRHMPPWDRDPLGQLVGTILSQHTSDRNSGAAFASLRARFPTWPAVAAAPTAAVAGAIRQGGLANVKALRIQEALAAIRAARGAYDLDFLRELPLAEARAWLRALPGVGPKTAACVLLFALGKPALPVDTHVHRVATRLGLVAAGVSAEAAHEILEALLQPEDVYDFHVALITHGRQVCHARRPRCGDCVLLELCAYGRRTTMSGTAQPGGPGGDSRGKLHAETRRPRGADHPSRERE